MSIYGPQGADLTGPVRGYAHRLGVWVKRRSSSYGVAVGLLLAAVILLVVAAGIGTAALFYFLELRYGPCPAYGVIRGSFAGLGAIALLVALGMLKRRGPPVPRPPSISSLLRQAAPLMATRLASAPRSGLAWRTDGTTRVLVTAAALLLIGWVASSRSQRHLPPEGS